MAPKKVVDGSGQRADITHLQFGLFSSEEVRALSEFEVVSDKGYEQPNRTPVVGGVVDRRLGVSDKINVCDTCGLKMNDCPGHFGYVKLELPIFHIGYMKPTLSLLQIICKSCSRVLLPISERAKMLRQLSHPMIQGDFVRRAGVFKRVLEACKKVKVCPYCEAMNGSVRRFGVLKFVHEKYPPKMKGEKADAHRRAFYVSCFHRMRVSLGKAEVMDACNLTRICFFMLNLPFKPNIWHMGNDAPPHPQDAAELLRPCSVYTIKGRRVSHGWGLSDHVLASNPIPRRVGSN